MTKLLVIPLGIELYKFDMAKLQLLMEKHV